MMSLYLISLLFMMGLIKLISCKGKVFLTLITLEMMNLTNFLFFSFVMIFSDNFVYIVSYLILLISEGSLSLGVLVNFIRWQGSDMMMMNSLC